MTSHIDCSGSSSLPLDKRGFPPPTSFPFLGYTVGLWSDRIQEMVFGYGVTSLAATQDAYAKKKKDEVKT